MPFLCCGSKSDEAVAEAKEGGDTFDNNGALSSKPRNESEERKLAESVYHDARQSLTVSMIYRPARASILRTNFSLDTSPEALLAANAANKATGGVKDSVVAVRQDLQQTPTSAGFDPQPGYPGSLTDAELEACIEFRKWIKEKRPEEPTYYEIVHCFQSFEEEAFALCRIMRARNFVVEDAVALLGESIDVWGKGRAHDFYPDIREALGCSPSILRMELPMMPYSIAKNGSMVLYFKAGSISLEGLDCLTDLDKFVYFIWHMFTHTFRENASKAQKEFPNVTILAEVTIVIDLKGISRSLFTEAVMSVLKQCIGVLNCFPEALSKLIIINAPFFFSAIWLVLKQFLDARTAQKVDIYATERSGLACIAEHIEESQRIADYGGTGPSSADIVHQLRERGTVREVVERFFLNAHHGEQSWEFALQANEKATVSVLTRSTEGAQFTVASSSSGEENEVGVVNVIPKESNQQPYSKDVASGVTGPGTFTVSAKSNSAHKEYFLVAVKVYPV